MKNVSFSLIESCVASCLLTLALLLALRGQLSSAHHWREQLALAVVAQQWQNFLALYPDCPDCQCRVDDWQNWRVFAEHNLLDYDVRLTAQAASCLLSQSYNVGKERRGQKNVLPRLYAS